MANLREHVFGSMQAEQGGQDGKSDNDAPAEVVKTRVQGRIVEQIAQKDANGDEELVEGASGSTHRPREARGQIRRDDNGVQADHHA